MTFQILLSQKREWFREPWVWLLIALPASAVLGGMVTIWIAVKSDDGLVVDDYYKRGLEINKQLDRDKAIDTYDLVAKLHTLEGQKIIQIELIANEKFIAPNSLKLSFLHPTIKGHDQILEFQHLGNGFYEGIMPDLINGNWYLQLEADDWRLLEYMVIDH